MIKKWINILIFYYLWKNHISLIFFTGLPNCTSLIYFLFYLIFKKSIISLIITSTMIYFKLWKSQSSRLGNRPSRSEKLHARNLGIQTCEKRKCTERIVRSSSNIYRPGCNLHMQQSQQSLPFQDYLYTTKTGTAAQPHERLGTY